MILFTDGGSTKCDWVLLDDSRDVVLKTRTLGLNPAVTGEEELQQRVKDNAKLMEFASKVSKLDFYGAGCGTQKPSAVLKKVLQDIFTEASVSVFEDTLAAVYATTRAPGIVCILGTGSNSSYFNGEMVRNATPSLGYSVMDEASGNYFGKQLLRDYFYKKMPAEIASEFEARFQLDPDEIKTNLYKKPNANRYLASFAEFIFLPIETREDQLKNSESYFYKLLEKGIEEFIECRILTYKESADVPIHFVGSIAYFSTTLLKKCFKTYNLQLGSIVRRPIDGLITYYQDQQ
ncbi:BadF/BadG/BcrA/BcrD ATPase family protein [Marinirhabdus gelatinilytica]|uniref:N-acetylglucosamine kinase-like BadF-type ATPase n=1 Tax=Marinirhabdus gelatinilytica TaxID=1703343 RepID=A0A370QFE4_9FLAO|nr:BadF/BadG/BcrA/BcrD ATPase family protein [Marinirhabdus gelatinilytica]RDK87009.1 N-acetylglucosamine kinase-like BadF-type ATPase [Marinirhabdus gelatinilytica]